MERISNANLTKLELHVAEMGYTVQSWGEPNTQGVYRPKVVCDEGKIRDSLIAKIVSTDTVLLYDHASRVQEYKNVIITADGVQEGHSGMGSTQPFIEEQRTKQKEAFDKRYNALKNRKWNDQDHPLAVDKKITLVNSFTTGGELYVPYVLEKGGEIMAAQKRTAKGGKYFLKDSQCRGAFNILNDGETDEVYGFKVGYLSESYTTACEILEAFPDKFVACCAGIGQLLNTWYALSEQDPTLHLIVVCDKPKYNQPQECDIRLKKVLIESEVPFIAPDSQSVDLVNVTDFNEVALKRGKPAVRREIAALSKHLMPYGPEVISQTAEGYKVICPLDGAIHTINKNKAMVKNYMTLAGPSYWRRYKKLMGIVEQKTLKKSMPDVILQNGNKNAYTETKGKGIFQEGQAFVANIANHRSVTQGGKTRVTDRMRATANNLYTAVQGTKDIDVMSGPLLSDHLECLEESWGRIFDLDTAYLYGILGWAVQGCYSGFTDHRAHMWLEGSSGSGKTLIQKLFLGSLFEGLTLACHDTTTAGLGQQLSNDDGVQQCPVVMVDEAGRDTEQKAAQALDLIMLARITASSDESSVSLRGTSDQAGRIYKKQCSLMFSSTSCSLNDHQDISRFLVVSLYNNLNKFTSSDIKDIKTKLRTLNAPILNKVITNAPHYDACFDESFEVIQKSLEKEKGIISHKVMALSACLAGASILFYNGDAKASVKKAFGVVKPFINDMIGKHRIMCKQSFTVIDDLAGFTFKTSESNVTYLLNEVRTNPDFMWSKYGIAIKKDNLLVIRRSPCKLHSLMTSRLAVGGQIHNIEDRLEESRKYQKTEKKQIRMGDERMYVFALTLPKELI